MKATTAISRILLMIMFCILLFIYASCQSNANENNNVIYHGTGWIIKELNDSVLICIPNNTNNQTNKPYIINIKNFNQDNQYEGI